MRSPRRASPRGRDSGSPSSSRAGRTRPRSRPRPRARRFRRASGRTGARANDAAPPRSERIIIRLRGQRSISGPIGDAEDHARQELAEEQDADPPGGARLVVERDPDGEERRPGSERRDQSCQQEVAVPAVLGHTDDRELRGELPQHPGRAYNLRGTASAVRNGRARAVEWRRWPAARGLTTNSSPACEQATGGPWRGRSRSSRAATPASLALLQELYPETGSAFAVGITGPPGVGKSSLIGALITHVRTLDLTVGVISIDPSSPFTHGALLGDRIRLSDHFLDPGVFIRSMGARGHLGGLAETTLQSLLAPRRRGDRRRLPRDRRGGAERGRGDERRRRGRARPDARLGRLGTGAEGRDHGDPGRDRDQQDGSARREGVAERHPRCDRARPQRRLAPADRPHRGPSGRGRRQAVERDRRAPRRARCRRRARAAPARQPRRRGGRSRNRACPCRRSSARSPRTRRSPSSSPRCSAARSIR